MDKAYFLSQLSEFFILMGNKTFWNGRHDLALKGLLILYTKVKNITEREENLLDAALIEYEKRLFYHQLKKK